MNINKRYPRDISILDQFQYTVSTRMHFRLMNSKQSWIINYEPYNMILSDECKNDSFIRLICFCRVGSASSSFSSMSFQGYNPFYNFMPSLWFIRIHIAHIPWYGPLAVRNGVYRDTWIEIRIYQHFIGVMLLKIHESVRLSIKFDQSYFETILNKCILTVIFDLQNVFDFKSQLTKRLTPCAYLI